MRIMIAKRFGQISAVFASLFGLLVAGSAAAQLNQARNAVALEEVVVTISKRAVGAQSLAAAVTALPQSALEQIGDYNAAAIADMVAGLDILATRPGSNNVTIRGIGTFNPDPQTISAIGYYLDEVSMSAFNLLPEIGFYDVERIEVLRGPQGTLFGDGSLGGTIRVVSNKPDATQFNASVRAEFGDVTDGGSTMSYTGMINVPLVQDTLAFRAVLGYKDEEGWVDAPFLNQSDINNSELLNGKAIVRYTPNDKLSIDFSYIYQDLETQGTWSTTEGRETFDPVAVVPILANPQRLSSDDSEYSLYSVTVDYDFGFAKLISSSSYFDFESFEDSVRDEFTPLFAAPGTLAFEDQQDQTAFVQELRLVSNDDEAFRWTTGVYYRDLEIDTGRGLPIVFFDLLGPGMNFAENYQDTSGGTQESWAVFAEMEYDFSDAWTLILGGRYFDTDRKFFLQNITPSTLFGDINFGPNETSESKFSPKVSLKWQASETTQLFATYAEGFRAGGGNQANASAEVAPGYDAESIKSMEIGIKSNPTDAFQINAYFYQNIWDDLQLNDITSDGLSGFVVNAGEAEATGIELELVWLATENLLFNMNFSSIDAEIQETVTNGLGLVVAQDGNKIPLVPDFSAYLSARYDWRFANNLGGMLFLSYTHRDGFPTDIANTEAFESGEQSILDVRMGIETERWGVYAFANNVLDDDAILGSATALGVYTSSQYSRPRTTGISLSYKF